MDEEAKQLKQIMGVIGITVLQMLVWLAFARLIAWLFFIDSDSPTYVAGVVVGAALGGILTESTKEALGRSDTSDPSDRSDRSDKQ